MEKRNMPKTTKEKYNTLRADFNKFEIPAQMLTELKEITSMDELKEYIDKKEREFWKQSTPIATELCNTLIKLGEEYVKRENVMREKTKD